MLAFVSFLTLFAGKNEHVSGTYTYIGQGHESRDACREKAYRGACVEAVGNKFGWIVSGTTSQVETSSHGKENLYFQQDHQRVARGEWIADDGEPRYEYAFDSEGCLTVTCKVNGFARPLSNERLEFEAIPLRNGTDRRDATEQFHSGDSFRLLMHAPSAGYAAVFLIGDDHTVNTLLPYSEASADAVRLKGGTDIIFFDPAFVKEAERHLVDELRLTADSELDHYRLCVVYSPNRFVKPNDASIGTLIPRQLKLTDFNRWLQRISDRDQSVSIKNIGITVVP
ncbi:hypothetical protein [uncultured Muribaculum sp.]|nr:hypothetical protein [uncultured Muribaculum sp.]